MTSHLLLKAVCSYIDEPSCIRADRIPPFLPLLYTNNGIRHALAPRLMQYFRLGGRFISAHLLRKVGTFLLSRHINMEEEEEERIEQDSSTHNDLLIELVSEMPNLLTICVRFSRKTAPDTITRLIGKASHVRKIAISQSKYSPVVNFSSFKELILKHPSEDVRVMTLAVLIDEFNDRYGNTLRSDILLQHSDFLFNLLMDYYVSEEMISECCSNALQCAKVVTALRLMECLLSNELPTARKETYVTQLFPVLTQILLLRSKIIREYGLSLLHSVVFDLFKAIADDDVLSEKLFASVKSLLPKIVEIVKQAVPALSELINRGCSDTPRRLYYVDFVEIASSSQSYELVDPDFIQSELLYSFFTLISECINRDGVSETKERYMGILSSLATEEKDNNEDGNVETTSDRTSRGKSLKMMKKERIARERSLEIMNGEVPVSKIPHQLFVEGRLLQFLVQQLSAEKFANKHIEGWSRKHDGIKAMVHFVAKILEIDAAVPGLLGFGASQLRHEKQVMRFIFDCCAAYELGLDESVYMILSFGGLKRITADSHVVQINKPKVLTNNNKPVVEEKIPKTKIITKTVRVKKIRKVIRRIPKAKNEEDQNDSEFEEHEEDEEYEESEQVDEEVDVSDDDEDDDEEEEQEETQPETLVQFLVDCNAIQLYLRQGLFWNHESLRQEQVDLLRNLMAAWPVIWKAERRAAAAKSDDEAEKVVLKHVVGNKTVKIKMGPYRLLEKILNLDKPEMLVIMFHGLKRAIFRTRIVRILLRKEFAAIEDFEKAVLAVLARDECGNLDPKKEFDEKVEKTKQFRREREVSSDSADDSEDDKAKSVSCNDV